MMVALNAIDIYNPIAMPTNTTSYTVTVTDEKRLYCHSFGVGDGHTHIEFGIFIPSAFLQIMTRLTIFLCSFSSLTQIDLP